MQRLPIQAPLLAALSGFGLPDLSAEGSGDNPSSNALKYSMRSPLNSGIMPRCGDLRHLH